MTDDVKIEFRGDHIHVALGPNFEVNEASRKELWMKLRSACEEHRTCRVLVEGHIPGGDPETAEVIAAAKRTAVIPHLWLAFHFEGFVPDERSELYEVIAASQGVRVKHFTDGEQALKWLRSNAPS